MRLGTDTHHICYLLSCSEKFDLAEAVKNVPVGPQITDFSTGVDIEPVTSKVCNLKNYYMVGMRAGNDLLSLRCIGTT